MVQINHYIEAIKACDTVPRLGKVLNFYGLVVEASGPDVFLGELCEIYAPAHKKNVLAEVVGFRDGHVLLMPYGDLHGIHLGSEIVATGRSASVNVGEHLIGRIIDAFGNPLDGGELTASGKRYPLYPKPVNPLSREKITEIFETGVKSIDAILTMGKGQRMGIFAGSGVGKSTLLGMIATNSTADVNVLALIGERGREVIDFVKDSLGEEGLKRSVVIVATADQHALVRTHAAYTATAIAEYFKDQKQDVVLAMDSITRFAMSQREIGLAIGEPPTARGYTPSSFSKLPELIERAGNYADSGSITAFYTVLVEGDDFNEPVADNLRAILDGHMILSRQLAKQGQYPAVDVLQSISRVITQLLSDSELAMVTEVTRLMSLYEESKDLIDVGAYVAGQNQELDRAIQFSKKFFEFLKQSDKAFLTRDIAMRELKACLDI